ncbi:MAG TPA: hypothetical protein VFG62_19455, partial [Rhodopila sp.]|nr:hypothetical protein [Rhodopila sp.]
RSILDPRFQIPGQWVPPQPRSEIEAMLAVPVTLPAEPQMTLRQCVDALREVTRKHGVEFPPLEQFMAEIRGEDEPVTLPADELPQPPCDVEED